MNKKRLLVLAIAVALIVGCIPAIIVNAAPPNTVNKVHQEVDGSVVMPINEPQRVNVLPGDGININTYPDGKQGIGEFDEGEYLEFDFNITNAGIYKVGTYLAAMGDGVGYILTVDGTESVEILVNGYETGTGAPEGASGFDHFNYLKPFENADDTVVLKAGQHTIRVETRTGWCNVGHQVSLTRVGDMPELSANANLSDIKINGTTVADFNADTLTYNVTVDKYTYQVEASATAEDADANVVIAGNNQNNIKVNGNEENPNLTDGKETFTITVTAANDSQKVYTVNVTRAAMHNKTGDFTKWAFIVNDDMPYALLFNGKGTLSGTQGPDNEDHLHFGGYFAENNTPYAIYRWEEMGVNDDVINANIAKMTGTGTEFTDIVISNKLLITTFSAGNVDGAITGTVANTKKVIDAVQAAYPNANIHLLSSMPLTANAPRMQPDGDGRLPIAGYENMIPGMYQWGWIHYSPDNEGTGAYHKAQYTVDYNTAQVALAEDEGINYIDLTAASAGLVENGYLKEELSSNISWGYHLNVQGIEAYGNALVDAVQAYAPVDEVVIESVQAGASADVIDSTTVTSNDGMVYFQVVVDEDVEQIIMHYGPNNFIHINKTVDVISGADTNTWVFARKMPNFKDREVTFTAVAADGRVSEASAPISINFQNTAEVAVGLDAEDIAEVEVEVVVGGTAYFKVTSDAPIHSFFIDHVTAGKSFYYTANSAIVVAGAGTNEIIVKWDFTGSTGAKDVAFRVRAEGGQFSAQTASVTVDVVKASVSAVADKEQVKAGGTVEFTVTANGVITELWMFVPEVGVAQKMTPVAGEGTNEWTVQRAFLLKNNYNVSFKAVVNGVMSNASAPISLIVE